MKIEIITEKQTIKLNMSVREVNELINSDFNSDKLISKMKNINMDEIINIIDDEMRKKPFSYMTKVNKCEHIIDTEE